VACSSTLADAIVRSARRCTAFTAARRLAIWVGEGKHVTPKQVLRPVDVAAVARELDFPLPARIRSAADVLALHRPWTLALAVGFLRIGGGHVRTGPALEQWPDADDDTIRELWLAGLATAFTAALPDANKAGTATFARVMLTALATEPTPPFADLWHRARKALNDEDADAAYWFLTAWRRQDDPLAPWDPLIELGAADRHGSQVTITPLGRWALQETQARAPKPITPDLSAGELIALLTGVEEDDEWYAAQPWLIGRTPLHAARELLAAAATATPAQRIAAVELIGALGPEAEPAWDDTAIAPNLAVHARAINSEDASAQDSAWLTVEYAAAGLTRFGPDEALSRLDELVPGVGLDSRIRAVECGTHPATADLADALTAFLASGATPTSSRAVQLKISLNRMRYPVWRRVLIPATANLGMLHEVIQIVMDWDGDHLHAFAVGRKSYGDPFCSPDLNDEEGLRCSAAVAPKNTITYRYDFGAGWHHTILCERVLDLSADTTYPVCVAGEGDSPIEDWTSGPESTPFEQDTINRRLAELAQLTSPGWAAKAP